MPLYCSNCLKMVPEGSAQCYECKAGFVHQLICYNCKRPVQRGASTCTCGQMLAKLPTLPSLSVDRPAMAGQVVRAPADSPSLVGFTAPPSAPPALPGLPAHVKSLRISEEYNAGRYGVTATVSMPAKDVEIMNKLGQMVVLLHTVAQEMNQFQGHAEHTRSLIRAMRNLATDIQDEIEMRTGPPT